MFWLLEEEGSLGYGLLRQNCIRQWHNLSIRKTLNIYETGREGVFRLNYSIESGKRTGYDDDDVQIAFD